MALTTQTQSAGMRVAQIFELLEQILLEVGQPAAKLLEHPCDYHKRLIDGTKTLLKCQQVSKAFFQTIEDSDRLQRALCHKPLPVSRSRYCRRTLTPGCILYNPYYPTRLWASGNSYCTIDFVDQNRFNRFGALVRFHGTLPQQLLKPATWQKIHELEEHQRIVFIRVHWQHDSESGDGYGNGKLFCRAEHKRESPSVSLGDLIKEAITLANEARANGQYTLF